MDVSTSHLYELLKIASVYVKYLSFVVVGKLLLRIQYYYNK